MPNVDIEIDVHESDLVALEEALMDGLGDGIDDSLAWMVRKGTHRAKSRIRATDRVWRRKVYHGWQHSDRQVGDTEGHAEIVNVADHAAIVDKGLAPQGIIRGANPQVQHIIQWVSETLFPKPNTSDPSNWDPELEALASAYSPGYVLTAFAVKEKIDKEGYPGIDFTGAAERYLKKMGPMVVHRKVEKHMNRELRKRGLK